MSISTAILNRTEYLDKVSACWLGKNIGGTLGAPMEWRRQINHVSFYLQDLRGEPVPNDDLDLQLVWLASLENHGVDIDAHTLADYWLLYVTPHYAEYGTAKTNLRRGLLPPLSGMVDNDYKDSCGAFIRSEIWACLAPGLPAVAARYAREDAIVDHGDGEGTYAAVLIAAMQSAAFVVRDLRALIEIGLSYIPPDCGVARAVRDTLRWFDEGKDWRTIRDEILRQHRGMAFFGDRNMISEEDFAKGFFDGRKGYDAPSNLAILLLGLLWGGDDFDRMICTTVNCGEDTDCTAATAAALWGLLRGQAGIPEKWIAPIGRRISTLCVNNAEISPLLPKTVEELTERTVRLAEQVLARYGGGLRLSDEKTNLVGVTPSSLHSPDGGAEILASLSGPRFRFPLFTVHAVYPDGPYVRTGEATKLRLRIDNSCRVPAALTFRWYCPEDGVVSPGGETTAICQSQGYRQPTIVEFTLSCGSLRRAVNRFVLEITAENRACVMHIPVVLLHRG